MDSGVKKLTFILLILLDGGPCIPFPDPLSVLGRPFSGKRFDMSIL